jgi:hypothetical protein
MPTAPVKIAGPVPANHAAITVANMKSANGAVVSEWRHDDAQKKRRQRDQDRKKISLCR